MATGPRKPIVRKEEWRQASPRDQIVALLMSIEGDLSNMEEGIGDPRVQLTRAHERCRDVQRLMDLIPQCPW